MTRRGLTAGLMICFSALISTAVLAQWTDEMQVSQSLPDIVPLMNALRNVPGPDGNARFRRDIDEQVNRELASLRAVALSAPSDIAGRGIAGKSACLLGLLYLHGAAVPLDLAMAKQWFSLCAHYGDPMASAGLAWCALDGCQSAPNLSLARTWVQRLVRVDPARAAYFQWLIAARLRPLTPQATEGLRALSAAERDLLENSVLGGNMHAMIELGILYAQSNDLDRALQLFDQASGQSSVASLNAAWIRQRIADGQMANTLPGVSRTVPFASATDNAPGLPLDPGNPVNATPEQAQMTYITARRFHRGDGVTVNYAEAIRLYTRAAEQGSVIAKRMLALIYARTTPEGGLDTVWMRQLGDLDVNAPVPKQDAMPAASALRREPTPLIDLLPNKWRQWMD
jgi:TPR repeat protein